MTDGTLNCALDITRTRKANCHMPKFKQAQIKMETCPNGHPRTQENQMNGKRYMCRACLEERVLAKRLYREFRKTGKRP